MFFLLKQSLLNVESTKIGSYINKKNYLKCFLLGQITLLSFFIVFLLFICKSKKEIDKVGYYEINIKI